MEDPLTFTTLAAAPIVIDGRHIPVGDGPARKATDFIAAFRASVPDLDGSAVATSRYYDKIYKPFLRKTIKSIAHQTTVHKWALAEPKGGVGVDVQFRFHSAQLFPNDSKQREQRARGWNVSVICFGKSLTFMLIYLAFTFRDLRTQMGSDSRDRNRDRDKLLHISLICDHETAAHYKTDRIQMADANLHDDIDLTTTLHARLGHAKRGEYKLDKTKKKRALHSHYGAETPAYYGLTAADLATLRLMDIYLVESRHPLAKGVGAKRGLIQQLHADFARKLRNPDAFVCMTLDDNITNIVAMEPGCSIRDPDKDLRAECRPITCLNMYNQLHAAMRAHPSLRMTGINKGNGAGSNTDTRVGRIMDTDAVYKLNLSRPDLIRRAGVVYNPFFTRFFEDVAFNRELSHLAHTKGIASSPYIGKLSGYHLTYGHIRSAPGNGAMCNGTLYDHDDDLPTYLSRTFHPSTVHPIAGVRPLYAMYFLFVAALIESGQFKVVVNKNLTAAFSVFTNTSDVANPADGESKYGNMTIPMYLFAIAYAWRRPIIWPTRHHRATFPAMFAHMTGHANYERSVLIQWMNRGMVLPRITPEGARANMLGSVVDVSIAFGEADMADVVAIAAHNDNDGTDAKTIPSIETTKEWSARLAQLCADVRKMNALKGNSHILMTMDVTNAPRATRTQRRGAATTAPKTVRTAKRVRSRTRSRSQILSTPSQTRSRSQAKRTRY